MNREGHIDNHHTPAYRGTIISTWLLGVLASLLVLWTLREAMAATLPVACALLVALAVWPVCAWVQQRMPKAMHWAGYVVAILLVFVVLALFLFALGLAAGQIADGVRVYGPMLEQKLAHSPVGDLSPGGARLADLLSDVSVYVRSAIQIAWDTISGLIIILFLILLMLDEADDWRCKLAAISSREGARNLAVAAVTVGERFRRYFLARVVLGAITGLLYAAWLALFDLDFLLVWALFALLLNFIPTVGSLIAGMLPLLFALLQKDFGTVAVMGVGLLAIEQVMGNYVDPKVMGRQLSLSPLVVLISLLLWGWVWGFVGVLIAEPLTMLVTILFAQVPALRPAALLLSNKRGMDELDVNAAGASSQD
jgi:AI-2 transport protein TqsA